MDERISKLEILTAFQDNLLQQLNDVVTRQQADIDLLKREITQLKERIKAAAPGPVAPQSEEVPPPHY